MSRVIVGILLILFVLFAVVMIGGTDTEMLMEAYGAPLGISAVLVFVSAILGIARRKHRTGRIVSAVLMLLGSVFGLYVFIALSIASSIAKVSIADMLGGSDVGQAVTIVSVLSIVTGLLSIILLVLSLKKPKPVEE